YTAWKTRAMKNCRLSKSRWATTWEKTISSGWMTNMAGHKLNTSPPSSTDGRHSASAAPCKRLPHPAEWLPQQHIYTCWPSHPDLWPVALLAQARQEITELVTALSAHTPCSVLAYGDEAEDSARQQLPQAATVIAARFGDIWLRDTGPLYTSNGDCLRFQHNGWGNKYRYEFDDEVGDSV